MIEMNKELLRESRIVNLSEAVAPNFVSGPEREIITNAQEFVRILSYLEKVPYNVGGLPLEQFNQVTMSTKPYGTCGGYYDVNISSNLSNYYSRDFSDVSVQQLVGEAMVLDVSVEPGKDIGVDVIRKASEGVKKGDIVLIRTGYSENYRKPKVEAKYYEESPGLTIEAAKYLATLGIKMVGIDTYTLEPTYLKRSKEEKDVHQILHSSRIVTVEDLTNLSKIKNRRPFAICGVPLKIKGLLGGPVRMVVIDETGEIIDCSHELFNYPEPEYYPEPYTFTPPISRHWEPTFKPELPSIHSATRLHPFIVEGQGVRGFEHKEAYVTMGGEHYGCHVEGPFTPPEILVHLWGESHNFSKELLKKYRRMPLDKMIGEASIVDLTDQIGPEQEIEVGVLEKAGKHVRKNDIVIINTGYYEWYGATSHWGTFTPGFRIEAAEWLVHKEIKTLVVDFPGVDLNKGGYSSNRVHYLFHAHDIPIIEKVVNLWKMAAKRIFFFALPLPVCAVTAYPTHVIAFEKKST